MPPVLFGADPSLLDRLIAILIALLLLWPLWLPLAVGTAAVFLLLPRPRPYPWYYGAATGLVALVLAVIFLIPPAGYSGPHPLDRVAETALFYIFAGMAVVAGALLVTQHNPARAALSFALVILSVCGMFLLLAAPFLMAATIIIYAGAIIVIFLFVLMLAQQAGLSNADARSREPFLASLTGFFLLATLLYVLRSAYSTRDVDALLARIAEAQRVARAAQDIEKDEDRKKALENDLRKLIGESSKEEQPSLFRESRDLLKKHGLKDLHLHNALYDAESAADVAEWQTNPTDSYEALEKFRKTMLEVRARLGQAKPPLGYELSNMSGTPANAPPEEVRRHADTRLPELPAENAAYLGRSLFTDYLVPVELGGLLLLVSAVGAIAIARRRES